MMKLPAALAGLLWLVAGAASAQCAMCAEAAANAGPVQVVSRALGLGIALLLLPTLGIMSGFGYLLWRYRGRPDDERG
jgi:hypothetical protein